MKTHQGGRQGVAGVLRSRPCPATGKGCGKSGSAPSGAQASDGAPRGPPWSTGSVLELRCWLRSTGQVESHSAHWHPSVTRTSFKEQWPSLCFRCRVFKGGPLAATLAEPYRERGAGKCCCSSTKLKVNLGAQSAGEKQIRQRPDSGSWEHDSSPPLLRPA